ncbi:MAG TPA: hypothetical protein VE133_16705 [Candidatus Sulfotelmatobacter sp.]|nr:hypothetical protein [Candidatus Sulfotelmatobacter sp.]
MLLLLNCPICGKSSVEPILQTVKILARYERFKGDIGGLRAYRCRDEGHIFFVRLADLQSRWAETLAS